MTHLTKSEYQNFVAAVNNTPYDRATFDRAVGKFLTHHGMRPNGMDFDKEISRNVTPWRQDRERSISFANKHQAACEEAWNMYWKNMRKEDMDVSSSSIPLNKSVFWIE